MTHTQAFCLFVLNMGVGTYWILEIILSVLIEWLVLPMRLSLSEYSVPQYCVSPAMHL